VADESDNEKTEEPTQKRLDDALKRGDVVKSQEVNTWFVLGAATLIMLWFAGSMSASLMSLLRGFLGQAHNIRVDGRGLISMMQTLGSGTIAAIAVPFLILMLAAIAGNMIQHQLVWSTESMKPKLSKISPLAGFKRMFSKIALMNFVKGLIKLGLIGAIMGVILWPRRNELDSLITVDPAVILPLSRSLSLDILVAAIAVLAVVAAADYLFQYYQWREKLKMSLQEIKEEYKQTEGDPAIKAKIRLLRVQRMRQRMMADVPKASVIITNPTHYAVALKYERGMDAPVCVAKGVDNIALKIREVAGEHDIPIVENPPLARALYATVDIDEDVPPEHYKAVAEVIGYVMRLKGGLRN
jgi:flagellar biosynthetic protein FlhB